MQTSEYWDQLPLEERLGLMTKARDFLLKQVKSLEEDCRIMALRLCGEDEDTFAPETRQVMKKWRPKVLGNPTDQAAQYQIDTPKPAQKDHVIHTWDIVMLTTDGKKLVLEDIPDGITDAIDSEIKSRYPISWNPEEDKGR